MKVGRDHFPLSRPATFGVKRLMYVWSSVTVTIAGAIFFLKKKGTRQLKHFQSFYKYPNVVPPNFAICFSKQMIEQFRKEVLEGHPYKENQEVVIR